MAIAPQNIMSKLRGMNDQQLAQYAQMHQQDPYIFPLAFQESQNRQHMRAAGQAQMAGQQQPKVVEQDLQQMLPQELPEDVGIAQLPADNMKSMAGGGIIAFEEGGEVPRFNGQYGSVPMSYGDQMSNLAEFLNPVTRFRQLVGDPSLRKDVATPAKNTASAFEIPESTITGTGDTSGIDQMAVDLAAQQKKQTQKAPPAAPAMPGSNVGLAGLAAGKAGSKSSLFQKEELPTKEDYSKEYDTLYKALDEKNAKFLEGQKAKLKTDREEALYMSMIKGGLAAAAGTSQYGLTNLAKGFGEGAEDFSGSLKEFRKAAQETAKAELEMERAQADRKAGRLDKYDARMESVKNRQLEADKAILSANTTLQAASTTAGAHLKAAQMPGAQERLFASLGGGDVAKGLKIFQEAQADKTGASYASLYAKHVSDAEEKGYKPKSPELFAQEMQQFLAVMQGGGFQQQPTNTTVRKLPGTQ